MARTLYSHAQELKLPFVREFVQVLRNRTCLSIHCGVGGGLVAAAAAVFQARKGKDEWEGNYGAWHAPCIRS
jgi:hypothetical protein